MSMPQTLLARSICLLGRKYRHVASAIELEFGGRKGNPHQLHVIACGTASAINGGMFQTVQPWVMAVEQAFGGVSLVAAKDWRTLLIESGYPLVTVFGID